jgi:hypothetical protein
LALVDRDLGGELPDDGLARTGGCCYQDAFASGDRLAGTDLEVVEAERVAGRELRHGSRRRDRPGHLTTLSQRTSGSTCPRRSHLDSDPQVTTLR